MSEIEKWQIINRKGRRSKPERGAFRWNIFGDQNSDDDEQGEEGDEEVEHDEWGTNFCQV